MQITIKKIQYYIMDLLKLNHTQVIKENQRETKNCAKIILGDTWNRMSDGISKKDWNELDKEFEDIDFTLNNI